RRRGGAGGPRPHHRRPALYPSCHVARCGGADGAAPSKVGFTATAARESDTLAMATRRSALCGSGQLAAQEFSDLCDQRASAFVRCDAVESMQAAFDDLEAVRGA